MVYNRDKLAGVRILIVDDHALLRRGLRNVLESMLAIDDIREACNGEEAIGMAMQTHFDVILMDIALPGISGLEASERILRRRPDVSIIVITGSFASNTTRRLLGSGVRGYISKGSSADEIGKAVRQVMAGERYLSADVAQQLAMDALDGRSDNPFDQLTAREHQIVDHLLGGRNNRQISETLHISQKTVSTHRTHAFDKLGIATLTELVRLAMQHDVWTMD